MANPLPTLNELLSPAAPHMETPFAVVAGLLGLVILLLFAGGLIGAFLWWDSILQARQDRRRSEDVALLVQAYQHAVSEAFGPFVAQIDQALHQLTQQLQQDGRGDSPEGTL